MKNVFVKGILIIIIAVVLAGGINLLTMNNEESATYTLATCVAEVDEANDAVICKDNDGNLWEFYGCDGLQSGDCIDLLMNDHGTPTLYDDEVVGFQA